jgi:hypothetical protein
VSGVSHLGACLVADGPGHDATTGALRRRGFIVRRARGAPSNVEGE